MNTNSSSAEDLFLVAAGMATPELQAEFLDRECAGDAALRAGVENLLARSRRASDFFGEVTEIAAPGNLTENPGERIGRYKLLQQIGEGGFGTVWMAEQMEPVTRRVALKIIKRGMDTREVIARFEAERQALAMMDHPNIAKVLDAGATDKGRPFFVMELVKGMPITHYCDEAGLGTRERLTLFDDVCSAINHAHQKGVIHRDIKPSNVMITLLSDKPLVKVIDFGIAKATQGRLTDKTLFTRFEQFIGTPVYMSPEQAALSALDVDTRSDIYALGILLYELLTGKPPFDAKTLASAGYEEMRRIIREVEPPKPSSRLSSIAGEERTLLAKARQIEPDKISRLVEPDLDWIVMKAIEKDRTRRYETANGLALDIQRFLADEPVSATPPSAAYRFRKFARRNRTALRVTAGIAVVLVAATTVSTWQAVRATRAERQQSSLRATAEESFKEADKQRAAAQAAEKVVAQQARELGEEVYASRVGRAAAALSRNGQSQAQRELATCDPQFRGWEWQFLNQPGRLLWTQPGAEAPMFTPDSRQLLACGAGPDGGFMVIRDSASGAVVSKVSPGQHGAGSPALSPDGSKLAFGDSRGNVVLWDLTAGKRLWSVPAHAAQPNGMVFSRDGSALATAGHDGSLKLFSASDGMLQREWRVSGIPLRCPALSPDGRRITVARSLTATDQPGPIEPAAVTVWDTATGGEVFSLKGLTASIHGIIFSPDGRWIVTAGEDHSARQWDAASGELVRTLATHAEAVTAVAFSPDGRFLGSASSDIQVREFEHGRLIHSFRKDMSGRFVRWIAFNSEGTKLAAYSKGNDILAFDLTIKEMDRVLIHGQRVWSVDYSADGKRLVSGGAGNPARVWDSATGEMLRDIPVEDGRFVTFSPDGLRVLIGGPKGSVGLWDVADGSPVRSFHGSNDYIHCGSFSPDGRRVAAAGRDKVLRVWDTATGGLVNEFRGHHDWSFSIYSLAFSRDGSQIVTGGGDRTVRRWDVDSGRLLQTLEQGSDITVVAFSPDGKTVADGGTDLSVRLWEAATGRPLLTLAGAHQECVWAVAFSPDGKRIATGDSQGALVIWNAVNGRFLLKIDLAQAQEGIWDLAWKPDGTTIASAGTDGTIRLWGISTPGASGVVVRKP